MVEVEYWGNTSNWHKPIYLIEGSFWCLFTLRTLLFLFISIILFASLLLPIGPHQNVNDQIFVGSQYSDTQPHYVFFFFLAPSHTPNCGMTYIYIIMM